MRSPLSAEPCGSQRDGNLSEHHVKYTVASFQHIPNYYSTPSRLENAQPAKLLENFPAPRQWCQRLTWHYLALDGWTFCTRRSRQGWWPMLRPLVNIGETSDWLGIEHWHVERNWETNRRPRLKAEKNSSIVQVVWQLARLELSEAFRCMILM